MSKKKGFKRSKKEWEESIAGHIGKIIDNSNIKDLAEVGLMGYLGFLSMNLAKRPEGFVIGPLAYKLATTSGGGILSAQSAGLSMLAWMGLATVSSDQPTFKPPLPTRFGM